MHGELGGDAHKRLLLARVIGTITKEFTRGVCRAVTKFNIFLGGGYFLQASR
jgi:hypothetical protein